MSGTSDLYPPTRPTVRRLALFCVLAGVIVAGLLFPVVGGVGIASNHASELVAQGSADIVDGEVPTVSTMVDAAGKPIAWLFVQRRWEVPTDRIADTMKLAIVSIEDKRFAAHNGVDIQGTLTNTGNTSLYTYYGGTKLVFNNSGTFTKSTATGETYYLQWDQGRIQSRRGQ